MPQMSTYIKKLEGYADLEVSIIRTTKINKVLKALIKLNTIPRDEEFQFRKRSLDLLSQWNKILGAEPADADGPTDGPATGDKDAKSTPTTNGVHDRSEEPADEKKDESPSQDEQAADTPVQPEATTEAEKPANEVLPATEATEPSATEKPEAASTEEQKAALPVPDVIEKAPESAAAANEAADVVKSSE